MTDFNSLPLAEQLKRLEAGDELHLRGGGWLPFVEYDTGRYCILSHGGSTWTEDGDAFSGVTGQHDIIRAVRPAPKEHLASKVPDVSRLRLFARSRSSGSKYAASNWDLADMMTALADHFERGEQP